MTTLANCGFIEADKKVMENSQNFQESQPQPIHEPSVSFPAPQPESGGGFPKWIFAVIGLLVVLAGGGFFLYQGSVNAPTPTPTPFVSSLTALPSPTITSVPTPAVTTSPTPAATPTSAQRSAVSIEVQNGTGTTGDAGIAKSALERAGYSKVTTANASVQNATSTTVTSSSDVSSQVLSEIISALRLNFGEATVGSTPVTGTGKVQVVTGPKISSQTATPSSKTTSPSPVASPATRTMSPTATSTATPR